MRLGELTPQQLAARLRGAGLRLSTGPFVFSISSPLSSIAESLLKLYRDFPIAGEREFVDFHVRIQLSSGIRRLFRPQSIFDVDGFVPFKPLPGKQAFALLEWGMNWCIYSHAHQFLIIHGAVLERNGYALLMPAPSGSGKSTLCAALMCSGWRLLSDELILVNPKTGTIHPLCRPVSLKNQSIEILRNFAPDAVLSEPIPDTSKGTVAHMRPTSSSVNNIGTVAIPRRVIFPRYCAGSDTTLTALKRSSVFMSLVENAFNYSLLGQLGFDSMSRLVEAIDGFSVEYSSLEDVVTRLNDMAFESLA